MKRNPKLDTHIAAIEAEYDKHNILCIESYDPDTIAIQDKMSKDILKEYCTEHDLDMMEVMKYNAYFYHGVRN